MVLDFTKKGSLVVEMKDYLWETIKDFPEEVNKVHPTPATSHLFTINKNCKKLDEGRARSFHTITAKLLFACNQTRPNIMVVIAFLKTRVKEPEVDNWKKLK
eukprot:4913557-Ditylum_brightwellii.AAC.1